VTLNAIQSDARHNKAIGDYRLTKLSQRKHHTVLAVLPISHFLLLLVMGSHLDETPARSSLAILMIYLSPLTIIIPLSPEAATFKMVHLPTSTPKLKSGLQIPANSKSS